MAVGCTETDFVVITLSLVIIAITIVSTVIRLRQNGPRVEAQTELINEQRRTLARTPPATSQFLNASHLANGGATPRNVTVPGPDAELQSDSDPEDDTLPFGDTNDIVGIARGGGIHNADIRLARQDGLR